MESVVSNPDRSAIEDFEPAAARDWVAVSFNFEDLPWCDWLYREFDGERVPRPLLGRPSRDGLPYPDRISVTPDPADPTQLEEFGHALRTAQHLIVVVSPNSGNDHSLREHMRIFKGAGGEQRIVALVVNGEPASPAAQPASEADFGWLPKWLQWRFEGNRFKPADAEEPLVVDARLGAASLAEVRMRLFAAMLEVPREELSELGVVMRATTDVRELPAPSAASRLPIADALISPKTFLPDTESASGMPKWPLIFCAMGALAALGFLAFGPAVVAVRPLKGQPTSRVEIVRDTLRVTEQPMTAVVALDAEPLPDFTPVPTPKEQKPPTPDVSGAATSIIPILDPAEQAKRELAVIAARRDRLVRLADSKLADGLSEDALAIYHDALREASQIVSRGGGNSGDVVEAVAIQRRIAYLTMNISSSAEARAAYNDARSALLALRKRGALPENGAKLLQEIEVGIRSIPQD